MRRRDEGVAALELALTLTVVLGVLGLALPLPFALLEKSRLEQAANRTVRWATSVPHGQRALPAGLSAEQRVARVRVEAADALALSGSDTTLSRVAVTDASAAACPLRRSRTVTLETEVDLGPLAVFVDVVRPGPTGPMTLTATATACEE